MIRNYLPGPLQAQYNQDPRLAIAQQMIQEGSSAAPIQHWAQGLGRLAQTLAGNYKQRKVQEEYDTKAGDYRSELAKALAGPNAIQGLSQSQDPMLQEMGLNAQLQQLMRESPVSYKTLTDSEEKALGLDPAGVYQQGSDMSVKTIQAPKEAKAPQTRTIRRGQTDVYQEWTPENGWTDVSEGAAFAPREPKDPRIPGIVTLIGPDNQPISLQDNDPRIPGLLQGGYVQRSGADPSSRPASESELKGAGLLEKAAPELDTALSNFDAMMGTKDQLAGAVPVLGNAVQSEAFQRGRNSLKTISAAYLYSVSGAQAPDSEVIRTMEEVTPKFGDKPGTLADKKARLQNMIDSIRIKAGRAAGEATPGTPASPLTPNQQRLNAIVGSPLDD